MNSCYCGNDKPFKNCCELIHTGKTEATTAEELMKSRYSAFVKTNGGFLMKSHSTQTRDLSSKNEIVKWAKSVKWIKLEIVECVLGKENDLTGIVEFKAYYKDKIFKRCIHERSNFLKEDNKWVYLNGEHL